jgi:response regulator RpfG family c-di-GMP phosphodiesterase
MKNESDMSKYRVLIVEEEADIIELLRLFLGRQGHEIIVETQGVKALETCAAQRPDIVLADIDLHGTSGFTIYTKLRDDPETANLPVALLARRSIPFGFPLMTKPDGIFFLPVNLRSLSSYIEEKCQSWRQSSNSAHRETSAPDP